MRRAARAVIACCCAAAEPEPVLTAAREADAAVLVGVGVVTPPKSLRKFAVQLSWFSVAYVVQVVRTRRVRT